MRLCNSARNMGPRHVEVESMYNTERYRPKYDHKLGIPIFLTRA